MIPSSPTALYRPPEVVVNDSHTSSPLSTPTAGGRSSVGAWQIEKKIDGKPDAFVPDLWRPFL